MEKRNWNWTLALVAAAFAGGALFAEFMPRASAQAELAVLPPIFVEGARLLGPTGAVEVHEILGGWIRAKSLGPLAKPGEELWMHVPCIPGTWLVDTRQVGPKK